MAKKKSPTPLGQLTNALRFSDQYERRVCEAAEHIRRIVYRRFGNKTPEFGVVLGSGLGDL
ncbi:MAG: hypothetical protein AAB855_02430, partial [Patescibacteria group bacterium]